MEDRTKLKSYCIEVFFRLSVVNVVGTLLSVISGGWQLVEQLAERFLA